MPPRPAKAAQVPRQTVRTAVLTSLLVAVLSMVPFVGVVGNGFVYDDKWSVVENPDYRGLGPRQLAWMFTTFHMGHYQPLTWVTLGLDYVLWGENPRGYHLTSLLLHGVNAALVYVLCLALLSRATDRGIAGAKAAALQVGAVLAGLFFGVHPLRVESVAWVTDRADLVCTLFVLLTLLCYVKAHPAGQKTRRRWLGGSIILLTLALLSRGAGVALAGVLLLLDLYPLRRLAGGSRRPGALWLLLLEKVPFALIGAVFAAVAFAAKSHTRDTVPLELHPLSSRFLQACYGLWFYLAKALVPVGLVPMYELHPPLELFRPRYLVPVVATAVAAVGLLRYCRRAPALATAAGCYAVGLLPVLGFGQAGWQEVADRYVYFPGISWACLAGGGASWLWRRLQASRRAKAAAVVPAALVLVALGALSWKQVRVWQTEESLWSHAVSHGPSSAMAFYNYGTILARKDQHEQALAYFQRALVLRAGFVDCWYNLGNTFTVLGRWPEAIRAYRELLARAPNHASGAYQLGNALLASGDAAGAVRAYELALEHRPDHVDARTNMGTALVRLGRREEALAAYQQALALDPQRADIHYNLGNCLADLERYEEALTAYRTALRINPQFAEAWNNLGILLERIGRPEEAQSAYENGLKINPDHADARCNLAGVLLRQGLRQRAVSELEEVLRRHPGHAEAQRRLEALRRTTAPAQGP
jgi:tetratricopeptide (TPR) repeat protein